MATTMTTTFYNYPRLQAMTSMNMSWGDICYEQPAAASASLEDLVALSNAEQARRQPVEDSIYPGMREVYPDIYDLSGLADWQYTSCMAWICAKGWHIDSEDRGSVRAWQVANPVSREWFQPLERPMAVRVWAADTPAVLVAAGPVREWAPDVPGEAWVTVSSAKPPRVAGPAPAARGPCGPGPKPAYIARFCEDSPGNGVMCEWSKQKHCSYEHGNTILRINRPCPESNCASHAKGLCPRMHRGEVWVEGAVLNRPKCCKRPGK
jgi:hypothetical protein